MDKLEQIKETIEGSAELLDKQQEYNFQFDEIVRIIQDYDWGKTVRLNQENWQDTTYLNPRLYNNEYLETDVRYYWDRQCRTTNRPIYAHTYWDDSWLTESVSRPVWTNTQTTTSGSDAVVAMPRHLEEWCDLTL